jgi:4-hydroxymandelate oxidase
LSGLINIAEYAELAARVLPPAQSDAQFGVLLDSEWATHANNLRAFEELVLRPRILAGIEHRDLATKVLGTEISLPILLGPCGLHGRYHPEAELPAARAAGQAGSIYIHSLNSNCSIDEAMEVATGPVWQQLLMLKDRGITSALLQKAQHLGCRAVVMTVDNPGVAPRRLGPVPLRYPPAATDIRALKTLGLAEAPKGSLMSLQDVGASWRDLAWARSQSPLPLVVKGIQTAEDARLCAEHGVDAVIVSNHGGHSASASIPSLQALPEVVEAVGNELEVYFDGGIRRGTDVLKALAIGARATLIGRPMLWGLTVDGEDGIRDVLEILRVELDVAMAMCGVASVGAVDTGLVTARGWNPSSAVPESARNPAGRSAGEAAPKKALAPATGSSRH